MTQSGVTGSGARISSSDRTCARRTAGDVVCWGLDSYGQLGDGGTTLLTAPVAVVRTLR
jgi:hypothetical protein